MNTPTESTGVPSVPDTNKRLLAHGYTMLLAAAGVLADYIIAHNSELRSLLPDWIGRVVMILSFVWNYALRKKETMIGERVEVRSTGNPVEPTK